MPTEPVSEASGSLKEVKEPVSEAKQSEPAKKPAAERRTSDLGKEKKRRRIVESAIRLRSVTKRFGEKVAVDNVTMIVEPGTVFGLIGPNGAGKTTTFSILAGYLKPSEGEVEVLGFAPSHVNELRGHLGVLPQDALLPANDRVGEFLVDMARLQGMPSTRAIGKARDALEEVDGKEWWDTRCGALSHGMAKRVQLAQALLGDPDVVLLDEPTAGLDPRIAYEVRQLIKTRKGRCTLVVSSHNLQELEEICDAAAILDQGRLITVGTMADLTSATEEVHFKVALNRDLPLEPVRALPMVKMVEQDDERGELVVYFDRAKADAELVIAEVLPILLAQRIRISGVSKGRSLEQRVMDLTE